MLRGLADVQHRFISIDAGAYGTQIEGIFYQFWVSNSKQQYFKWAWWSGITLSNVKFPFAVPGYEEFPSPGYCLSPFPTLQLNEIKRIWITVCAGAGELLRVSWGFLWDIRHAHPNISWYGRQFCVICCVQHAYEHKV